MACPWELINCNGSCHYIAVFLEDFKVSGKACWLTGYIDHVLNAVADNFLESLGIDTIAGRIKDDHIRLILDFIENLEDITGDKFAVIEVVELGIFLGCLNCFLYDLNTYDFIGNRCKELSDSAGSGVKVIDYSIFADLLLVI